jgi:hypothetical protein
MEEEVAEVLEGEIEDGVKPDLESESAAAGTRRFLGVPIGLLFRFSFIAAPKLSAVSFMKRGAKISSGPVEVEKCNEPARSSPTHGRKSISFVTVTGGCTKASIHESNGNRSLTLPT